MPVTFKIKIADCIAGVTALYDSTYEFCRDYLTDGPFDFSVDITENDIKYERAKYDREAGVNGGTSVAYSEAYLETLAVYRKIASSLLNYNTLLFHGSAIAVDGEAYLFTAKSGVGKSTHAGLWRRYFGDRAIMINDDKPLLKITDAGVMVYGTPWNGKHQLGNNISAPLKAIAILERDANNHISKTDKRTALPMFYQQSFRPDDTTGLSKAMALIDKLGNNVGIYKLRCNMEPEAAIVAYTGMNLRGEKNEIE